MESIVPNPRIAHVQENAITAEIISNSLIKEDLMDGRIGAYRDRMRRCPA